MKEIIKFHLIRENFTPTLNKSNLKLITRVLSNDNINKKINEYNKKDQENLIRVKRNIPFSFFIIKYNKIKNKVINELIQHSKKIQSQSPIKNNNYNNL